MTKYREILRLHCLGHSIHGIALSVPCSRNTASRTVKRADEAGLKWQAACNMTDGEIEKISSLSMKRAGKEGTFIIQTNYKQGQGRDKGDESE